MRQLLIQVPRGRSADVLRAAEGFDVLNTARLEAESGDLVLLHLSNGAVTPFLQQLEPIPELHVSFFPRGVIALKPPAGEAPAQVTDVQVRSPIEVFLAGMQSIGAWSGFLGFAAAAGAVVWVGLFTNTIYLLTAAMLVAPFAGPAMNAAIATAAGDAQLLRESLLRYAGAIAVTVLVAGALSFVLGQDTATTQMIARSQISRVAVLLPLVAGAAGALSLVQSDRDSLVSGAAVGVLVAASLAPPAGLVGMAAAIGRWDLVVNGGFVLLLQLVGINLTGALVFRFFGGLSEKNLRYERASTWLFSAGLAVSALVVAGLLAWQFSAPLALERASLSQRAATELREAVDARSDVALVEASARFTRADVQAQTTLLGEVYVQRRPSATQPEDALRADLTRTLQRQLRQAWPTLTPLVSVTVLEPPDAPAGGG